MSDNMKEILETMKKELAEYKRDGTFPTSTIFNLGAKYEFVITTIESLKKENKRLNDLVAEGNFPIYRKEKSK